MFILAGCTLHHYNHYCAIISSERHGDLWYDGLVEFLQPMLDDICSWSHRMQFVALFPVYDIFIIDGTKHTFCEKCYIYFTVCKNLQL